MLKFTIYEEQVILDPSTSMIKEFTDIIEYGKLKKDSKLANQMLLYVFFCCDLSETNPLRDIDFRLKEQQAFLRAFQPLGKTSLDKQEVSLTDAAIDAYNFLNETALERATLAFDQKIDQIRTTLEGVTPSISEVTDGDGQITKYVSNGPDIEKFSKLLSDLAVYKLKAMETAKKIDNVGRVRGKQSSSLIERGLLGSKALKK
jgi:hypothetical protein